MPRRTPTAELQASEAPISSPLRRSSRIISNNSSTPTAAAVGTRRNSQTEVENNPPAKITKGRRASAQDGEEKIDAKQPLTRTRRASLLVEDESKSEATKSTPTRRGRRASTNETAESKPEEKPKPVRGRRSSASDQPDKKPAQSRGRRRSVDVELKPEESLQPPKTTTGRKKSPQSDNQNSEINTDKDTGSVDDKIKRSAPRRSRRLSTDSDTKASTPSKGRLDKEDVRSMSKSPQAIETTVLKGKDKDEDMSPILIQNLSIKLTPIKKTRLLDKVEAELDLSVIDESVDDINNSKLLDSSGGSKINAKDTGNSGKDEQLSRNVSPQSKDNVFKKRQSSASPDRNQTPRKSPRLLSKLSKDVTPSNLSFSDNVTMINRQDSNSEEEKRFNILGESNSNNKENIDVTTGTTQSITQSVLNSKPESKLQASVLHCEPCEPMDVDLSASEIAIMENKQKEVKEDGDSTDNYLIEETGNSVNISMKPKEKDSNLAGAFEKEISNKEPEALNKPLTDVSIMHITKSTSPVQLRKESTISGKPTSPVPGESYEDIVGLKQPNLQTANTIRQSCSPEKQMSFEDNNVPEQRKIEKENVIPPSPQNKALDDISKPITNLKHHLLNSANFDSQVVKVNVETSLPENNKSENDLNSEYSQLNEALASVEDDEIRTKDVDEEVEKSKNPLQLNQTKNETETASSSTVEVSTQSRPITMETKISVCNSDIQNSSKINERNTSSTVSAKTNESVPSDLTHYDFNIPSEDDDVFGDDRVNETKVLSDEENESNDIQSCTDLNSDEQDVRSENDNNTNLEFEQSGKQTSSTENLEVVDEDKSMEMIKSDKQMIGSVSDTSLNDVEFEIRVKESRIDKDKYEQSTLNENLNVSTKPKELVDEDKEFEKKFDKHTITSEFDDNVNREFKIRTKESSKTNTLTSENVTDEDKVVDKSNSSETDNGCDQQSTNDNLTVNPEQKIDVDLVGASNSTNSDTDREVEKNNFEPNSPHKQTKISSNVDSDKKPNLIVLGNVLINKERETPENTEINIPSASPPQDVQTVSDDNKNKSNNLRDVDNKLDDYIKSQMDDDSSSDEEEVSEVSNFFDDMAEEGEEDTPSEDSNQIIDEGESVGFSESDQRSTEDEYENDSFICDDEEGNNDLLPGEEYDLDQSKEEVRKSRIISPGDLPDDEIIQRPGKKKVPPVKTKSRIIRVSSSSSDEGNVDIFESINVPNKKIEQLKKMKCVKSTSSDSSVILMDSSVNESSRTVTAEESEYDEEESVIDEAKVMKQQASAKTSPETPVKADKSLQSRPRKSSLTIQENIIVDGSNLELNISKRINSLVDSFCSSVSKGEIAVNISLEYEDVKNDNVTLQIDDSDHLYDTEPESNPQLTAAVRDLRDVLNEKAQKRKLNKSMDDLGKDNNTGGSNKKAKIMKKTKKKGKTSKRSETETKDPTASSSFGLFNQLITDVKNHRPGRKIKPSRNNDDELSISSWNTSAIDNLKPSTSPASRKEIIKSSAFALLHPKDFRNRMLSENSKVKRINTTTLLKKKGAFI